MEAVETAHRELADCINPRINSGVSTTNSENNETASAVFTALENNFFETELAKMLVV